MLIVSLVFGVVTLGDAGAETKLPLTRVTLLRDFGCWLQWEGEVPSKDGVGLVSLPSFVDPASISVERSDSGEWRSADFGYPNPENKPSSRPNAAATTREASVILSVLMPQEVKSATIRLRAVSNSLKWRPTYVLELGKSKRLTMRCLATATHDMDADSTIECIASTATPRGGENDRWTDSTLYLLSAKRLKPGTASLTLFDGPVEADEYISVELGGMAGEPGVRAAKDRSISMIRLTNKSPKPWPSGEMLVTSEGRLVAKVILPHTDAGQSSDITLGAAVGIAVFRDEVEIERKTALIRRETDAPDSTQTAGSATITNHSGRATNVRATKIVAGDATAASDDAKIVRAVNRLGTDQPLNEIRWNFTLPAGQTKRLTYGTTIRVAQPSEGKDSRP